MTTITIGKEKRLVIKCQLPRIGVISSNPQRTVMIKDLLTDCEEIVNNWGIQIFKGRYKNKELFVASVALGSAGAAFACQEMFSAGAECIIRYGSNDYQVSEFSQDTLDTVTVVEVTDNLYGPMIDGGNQKTAGQPIFAAPDLVKAISESAQDLRLPIRHAVCHNTDNYFAANYPEDFTNAKAIKKRLKTLEQNPLYDGLFHSCDMESASLFYVARKRGKHAASVLQNIIKKGDKHVYDGEAGRQARERMIANFIPLVFNALIRWEEAHPIGAPLVKGRSANTPSSTFFKRFNDSDILTIGITTAQGFILGLVMSSLTAAVTATLLGFGLGVVACVLDKMCFNKTSPDEDSDIVHARL